jgi:glycosyltransferase involved in cell wall biosynthesis
MFALKAKKRGARIVWDLDDDLLNMPHWEPFASMYSPVQMRYLEESLAMADDVTVSTARLRDATIEGWSFLYKDDVHVLENIADSLAYFKTYDKVKSYDSKYITKILWTGSHTHVGDMGPVEAIMEHIQKVPGFMLIMFGYMPNSFYNRANIVALPWAAHWNYAAILSLISPDIALMPLLDCRFNHSKSAIKFYETGLAGGLCMASDVPPFSDVVEDQITGLLLPHDQVELWIDEIKAYRDNQEGVNEMRENARREIVECFSWNADNPRRRAWRDFYVSLAN